MDPCFSEVNGDRRNETSSFLGHMCMDCFSSDRRLACDDDAHDAGLTSKSEDDVPFYACV